MTNPAENIRLSNPENMAKPTGYSHVAEVTGGRLIFISGQVALDGDGNLVGPGDMEAQARQVFENIKTVLESCGATFANVVKLTFFTVDFSQQPIVRKIRDQYINPAQPPASSAVEVRKLFRDDILIEIEAVAAVPA
ncbi:MAG: enamine deaminase RidA [Chloroflexi bacterium]|jgi:reactive intermediate/imine deaminase|nr:enamine deaminase RidA [Chloroflexota bacterium]